MTTLSIGGNFYQGGKGRKKERKGEIRIGEEL
jgi:hypothetical protein